MKKVNIFLIFLLLITLVSCSNKSDSVLKQIVKEREIEAERDISKITDTYKLFVNIKVYQKDKIPQKYLKIYQEDYEINIDKLSAVCILKIDDDIDTLAFEFKNEVQAENGLIKLNKYFLDYYKKDNIVYYDTVFTDILLGDYKIEKDYVVSKDGSTYLGYFGEEEEITIPKGIEKLKRDVIRYLTVKKVICNSELKIILKDAFYANSTLETIVFNEGLEEIGTMAFYNCWKLKNINMPNSIIKIGDYAFAKCSSLNKVTFFGSPLEIGNYCFLECNRLTNIKMKLNNSTIWGTYIIYNSSNVKVTFIGEEPKIKPWKYNTFYIDEQGNECEIIYVNDN